MSKETQETRGRKPRNFYVDYTKTGARFANQRRGRTGGPANNSRFGKAPDISYGHRGFLITSVDEVKCYLEMRNILEEYHESLYSQDSAAGDSPENQKTQTTEDELESELKALRKNRPFKQVKTHCRNTIFLNILPQFTHIDPVRMVDQFFIDLAATRQVKTSNTYKVLPILDTFRCNVACAKESLASLLDDRFKEVGSIKYFIEFQSRGNYKLESDDKQRMIEGIADVLTELRPDWSVDREKSDYIIVLVALKNVCCISVLKNYFLRCKYNVTEFCKDFAPQEEKGESHEEEEVTHETSQQSKTAD